MSATSLDDDVGRSSTAAMSSGGDLTKKNEAGSVVEETAVVLGSVNDDEQTNVGVVVKKKAANVAQSIVEGSFMPMAADRPRNNVRSRFLLALLYCFGAGAVSVLILLYFLIMESSTWKFTWSVPPQESVGIGVTMTMFSAQVVNNRGVGVEGEKVWLAVMPIQDIDLVVTLKDSTFVSRTIQCLGSMLEGSGPHYMDDSLYCATQSPQIRMLLNDQSVTDSHGVARFHDVILTFGHPGTYMMLVGLNDHPSFVLSAFIDFTADEIVTKLLSPPKYSLELEVQGTTFLNLTANAVWYSRRKPVAVAACLISLELAGPTGKEKTQHAPVPATDTITKSLLLENPCTVAALNEIVPTSDGRKGMWEANFTIERARLLATNTEQPYLGLSIMNMIIPVSGLVVTSDAMSPKDLILPFKVSTRVANVTIVYDGLGDSVVELETLSVRALVTDGDGNPIAGHGGYLHVMPSFKNNASHGPTATLNPGISYKTYIGNAVASDKNGVIDFSTKGWMLSSTGAPGYYDISVAVDGVKGKWPTNSSGLHNGHQFLKTILVKSRVDVSNCVISWSGNYQNTAETVGEEWQVVPSAFVADRFGIAIPGKSLVAAARYENETVLTGTCIASRDDGVSAVAALIIPFATREGNHTFDFFIDGLYLGGFTRELRYPKEIPDECQFVRVTNLPPRFWSGVPGAIDMKLLRLDGSPVPNKLAYVAITADYITPPPGENQTVFGTSFSDSEGNIHLVFPDTGCTPFPLAILMHLYCNQTNPLLVNPLAFVVRSRLLDYTLLTLADGMELRADRAVWDMISEEYPLTVSGVARWVPSFAKSYYNQETDYPKVTTGKITNLTNPSAYITIDKNVSWVFGLFGFVPTADGCPMPSFETVFLPQKVASVRILESAFFGPEGNHGQHQEQPDNIIAKSFPYTPKLEALGFDGEPVEGVKLFAQVGLMFHNHTTAPHLSPLSGSETESITWVNMIQHSSSVEYVGFARTGGGKIQQPVTNYTDENGTTTLPDLVLLALSSKAALRVRYCYAQDSLTEWRSLNVAPVTVCAVENITIRNTEYQYQTAFQLSETVTGTSPGKALPPLSIEIFLNNGKPLPAAMCVPFLADARQQWLKFRGSFQGGPYGGFFGDNVVHIKNGIYLSQNIPLGTYDLKFMCPGGITPAIRLVVTATISDFGLPIPPPASVHLYRTFSLVTRALGSSGDGLGFKPLLMQLVSKQLHCVSDSCGVFGSDSILFRRANREGYAQFTASISAAEDGDYELILSEAAPRSRLVVQQLFNKELVAFGAKFGTVRGDFNALVQRRMPQLLNTFQVVETLADPDSGHLSTAGKSGGTISSTSSRAEKALAHLFSGGSPDSLGGHASAGADRGPAVLTVPLHITNPIARVDIVKEPVFSARLFMDPEAALGIQRTVDFPVSHEHACVVRIIGKDGQPVSGIHLTAKAIDGMMPVKVTTNLRPSDSDGVVTLYPMTISLATPGTFRLFVSASGGGGNTTGFLGAHMAKVITLTTWMKYISGGIIIYFSPILFMSVPFAKWRYSLLSILFTAMAPVILYFLMGLVPNNVYAMGYVYFIFALGCLVLLVVVVMFVLEFLGYRLKKYQFRFTNDEPKAEKTFLYTRWLLNVRADRQELPEETSIDRIKSYMSDRADYVSEVLDEKKTAVNRALDVELLPTNQGQKVFHDNFRRRQLMPPLLYDYPPEIEPIDYPVNFLVVVGIAIIFVIVVNYILVYAYQYMMLVMSSWVSMLPDINASPEELAFANQMLIGAMTTIIKAIVSMFPSLAELGAWLGPLQGLDIFGTLSSIRSYIMEFFIRLEVAVIVGLVISSLVVLGIMVATALRIPEMIRQIRRGQIKLPSSVPPMEGYIGLHCCTFVLVQVIAFFLCVIFALLLSVVPIREYLWTTLYGILLASVISLAVQLTLQKVLVGWFLSSGGYTVVRPQYYAVWHYVGLILGIFTAPVKVVVRWLQCIVFVTTLFSKLDDAIFPQRFAAMDKAHAGFVSIVVVEAKNSNPLYLMFCSWLLTERELRKRSVMLQLKNVNEKQKQAQQGEEPLLVQGEQCQDDDQQKQQSSNGQQHSNADRTGDDDASKSLLTKSSSAKTTGRGKRDMIIELGSGDQLDGTAAGAGADDVETFSDTEEGEKGELEVEFGIPLDSIFKGNHNISSVLKNTARLCLRWMAASSNHHGDSTASQQRSSSASATAECSLSLREPPSCGPTFDLAEFRDVARRRRLERVRARWWLLLLLYFNPSLRRLRKHYLFEKNIQAENEYNALQEEGFERHVPEPAGNDATLGSGGFNSSSSRMTTKRRRRKNCSGGDGDEAVELEQLA